VSSARASAAPLLLAALASATLALHFIDPVETRWLPFCLFHALTGLHCPGCGTTRALHLLAHGDLLGALRMNALAVSSIPLLAYASARRIDLGRRPRTIMAALALAVAFAIARNVPAYPFELLAPHPIARPTPSASGADTEPTGPQASDASAPRRRARSIAAVFAAGSSSAAILTQKVTTVRIDFPACISSNASLIRSSGNT
jgi:apolipoprotein N-acyltransferase